MGMNRILTTRIFDTCNDLPPAMRQSMIELLNERLVDVIDLELQAKQAHWNIKGPNFVGLHELFDRVALQAREYADEIAERAVALGGVARGTIEEIAGQSTLPAILRNIATASGARPSSVAGTWSWSRPAR